MRHLPFKKCHSHKDHTSSLEKLPSPHQKYSDILIQSHKKEKKSKKEKRKKEADSDFWDTDRRVLASSHWLHVFHLAPLSRALSALYFLLGRKMPNQGKWKLREKRSQYTRAETPKDKMAFNHAAVEGQRSLISPPFNVLFPLFIPSLLSSPLWAPCLCTLLSNHIKRCLHMLHKSLRLAWARKLFANLHKPRWLRREETLADKDPTCRVT